MEGQPVSPHFQERSARKTPLMGVSALMVLALAGCTPEQKRGFLPGDETHQITNHTERIISTWNGAWITLLAVGLLVWGLVMWVAIAYRRKSTDRGFPIQLRYHVPIELTFTIIPVIMIMTLFYFTQRDMTEIERLDPNPDVTINVVAKQWSWDFNYVDAGVYEDPGVQSFRTGEPGAAEDLPAVYVPVGQTVEFQLDSRDVIHSFWVVDFLYKKDMFPGHTTAFQVTPQIEGTYAGKCAELCGEYHSDMLFNVHVVSQEEFDARMEELAARGNQGQLGNDLNRLQQSWNMQDDSDARLENRREEAP